MSYFELSLIAVALSLDAFAVSVCAGSMNARQTHLLRLPVLFGLFQFLMPVLGWMIGSSVRSLIETWDHWIAFALLAWIGLSMIREARSENGHLNNLDFAAPWTALTLAVATSLDALGIGMSFSMLDINIWSASVLIGIVCTVIAGAGLMIGRRLGEAFSMGQWAERCGGCILVAIGVKILADHGVFV
ncbi:MAG: manganese efflux pump MntP family protein [Desulfovibrionaceae bacterium]|nr:manganese efflux pump MntP family protein [Desulfovibrionaceae bacterium]